MSRRYTNRQVVTEHTLGAPISTLVKDIVIKEKRLDQRVYENLKLMCGRRREYTFNETQYIERQSLKITSLLQTYSAVAKHPMFYASKSDAFSTSRCLRPIMPKTNRMSI